MGGGKIKNPLIRLLPAPLLIALLAWPLLTTALQNADFSAPTKTRLDRAEYLAGSSCGQSVQAAVEWLKQQAALHPITILTNSSFGTEKDFVWLSLSTNPNVQLLAADCLPFALPPTNPDGTITFCTEQWFPERTARIRLDPNRPTYTLQGINPNNDGIFVCNPLPSDLAPRGQLIKIIPNPPTASRDKLTFATAIVQLNAPDSPSPLATAAPQN